MRHLSRASKELFPIDDSEQLNAFLFLQNYFLQNKMKSTKEKPFPREILSCGTFVKLISFFSKFPGILEYHTRNTCTQNT